MTGWTDKPEHSICDDLDYQCGNTMHIRAMPRVDLPNKAQQKKNRMDVIADRAKKLKRKMRRNGRI